MGLCQYVDLCFHASSLPCLHTFCHAIPTSFYMFFIYLFLGVNLMQLQLVSSVRVTTTPELEQH